MVRELRLIGADPVRRASQPARSGGRSRDRYASVVQTADDSARSALLEALSRELRTTLALVSGYSQTLLHLDLDDEERGRYLARISVASEHVAELTEEVLSVTTSKNDGRPMCQAVAISSLLSQLGRQLDEETDPPRLIVQLPAALPLVNADPVWIVSVLRILVTATASDSADGRAVRIGARSTGAWVVVSAQGGDEPLASETSDSGSLLESRSPRVGAPALAAASVGRASSFDHDIKLLAPDGADVSSRPGLDFCRQLVKAHGGRIWLDETSAGVRVSFSLPRYWPKPMPVEGRDAGRMVGVLKS
jgi:two-component system sensor histidine kinase KdpD